MADPRAVGALAELARTAQAIVASMQEGLAEELRKIGCPDPERYQLSWQIAPQLDPKGRQQ